MLQINILIVLIVSVLALQSSFLNRFYKVDCKRKSGRSGLKCWDLNTNRIPEHFRFGFDGSKFPNIEFLNSTQLNPTKHIQKCLGIWLSFQHYRVYLGDEIQLEVQLEKISKCHWHNNKSTVHKLIVFAIFGNLKLQSFFRVFYVKRV